MGNKKSKGRSYTELLLSTLPMSPNIKEADENLEAINGAFANFRYTAIDVDNITKRIGEGMGVVNLAISESVRKMDRGK